MQKWYKSKEKNKPIWQLVLLSHWFSFNFLQVLIFSNHRVTDCFIVSLPQPEYKLQVCFAPDCIPYKVIVPDIR